MAMMEEASQGLWFDHENWRWTDKPNIFLWWTDDHMVHDSCTYDNAEIVILDNFFDVQMVICVLLENVCSEILGYPSWGFPWKHGLWETILFMFQS